MPASDIPSVSVSGIVRTVPSRAIRRAVLTVLHRERRSARIGVIFLGKTRMQRVNAEYLDHDTPTDVISFPLPQPDGSLAGDIYVCPFVAARNARRHGVTVRGEVLRLVIHGTLHILGWTHPEDDTRTKSPMWRRQEQYAAEFR